jgi:hypothetical protein
VGLEQRRALQFRADSMQERRAKATIVAAIAIVVLGLGVRLDAAWECD